MYSYPAVGLGGGASSSRQNSLVCGSPSLSSLETHLAHLPYHNRARVRQDVSPLLQQFPFGFFSTCGATTFVTNDGTSLKLLVLEGTVAITYQGVKYNIPVEIFLPIEYPQKPPLAFVRPNSSMEVKPGHSVVDSNGSVCRLPYLQSWGPGGTLHNLCGMLSRQFSDEPPVWTKPARQRTSVAAARQGEEQYIPAQQQQQQQQYQYQQAQQGQYQQSQQQPPSERQQLLSRLTERLRGDLSAYYDRLCRETDREEESRERLERSARAVEATMQRARRDRERMRLLNVDLRVQRNAELDRWEPPPAPALDDPAAWAGCLVPHDELSEQAVLLQARDRALDDALDCLFEALQRRVPGVGLDACTAETRDLAQQQFRNKALLARVARAVPLPPR